MFEERYVHFCQPLHFFTAPISALASLGGLQSLIVDWNVFLHFPSPPEHNKIILATWTDEKQKSLLYFEQSPRHGSDIYSGIFSAPFFKRICPAGNGRRRQS